MFHAYILIQPYIYYQKVYIYYNNDCVYEDELELKDIKKTIERLNEQYPLNHIDLCGNSQYVKHFANTLKDLNIPVEIIRRD